jgi:hypothetical protein
MEAKIEGSHNIIVQAKGDGIKIEMGLPHLTLIPPANIAPRQPIRSEIDLLNAYRRSIQIVGRDRDLILLWEWLHSPNPISIRTITGRAGAGKTRIAIELIDRLNEEMSGKWWAGFAGSGELKRFANLQNLADWGWARPTMIVVDYAASVVESLRLWLRELATNSTRADGRPLRVLMIEREASAGEGWLQSVCIGGDSEKRVLELFDPLEPKRLDRLESSGDRRLVLTRMLEACSHITGRKAVPLPAPGDNLRFDKQLEKAIWEDPLYLMMAALLSLCSDLVEVLDLPRTGLALNMVDHEIKRFTEGVSSESAKRMVVHMVGIAAIGNGLSREQAVEAAKKELAALEWEFPGGAGFLIDHLHKLLPDRDKGIAPVVPDIIAEALVIKAFGELSTGEQEKVVVRVARRFRSRVISFVIRTVQDFAPAGQLDPLNWVETLIKTGTSDDIGILIQIDAVMPHQTLILREKAAEVIELLINRLPNLQEENPSEEIQAEQSRL